MNLQRSGEERHRDRLRGGAWAGIGSAGCGERRGRGDRSACDARPVRGVPKPTGVGKGATGSFTGGLTRKGAGGTLSWRVTFRA